MTERPRFFDDLAGVAGGAFSALAGIREEAETLVRARVDEAIRRLDLVKREDLDAVQEMAANARAGQEAAERRIAALEAKLAAMAADQASHGGTSEVDPASMPAPGNPYPSQPTPAQAPDSGGRSEAAPGFGTPGSPDPSPDGAP